MAPPTADDRAALLEQKGAERPRGPGIGFCSVVADVVMVIVVVALLPVLIPLLVLLFTLPLLERLWHRSWEYLDGVSSAFLLYTPEAIILAVLVAKEHVPAKTMFGEFTRHYLSGRPEFGHFKKRAVARGIFWPYWKDVSDEFDPAYHMRTHTELVNKAQMEKIAADMQLQLMDYEKPLWDIHHFENYIDENGHRCSATIFRMQHAMGDGFTGLRMMLQGCEPNRPPQESASPVNRAQRRGAVSCLRTVHYFLLAIRKLILMQDDPTSTYKAEEHVEATEAKNVVWHTLKGISVADIKAVGKERDGATVNDILMTALAGALRRYVSTTPGAELPADPTTCNWVSLLPMKDIYTDFSDLPFRWGNRTLGAVYIKLPIADDAPQGDDERAVLSHLRQSLEDPSLMVEAAVATGFLAAFGALPRAIGTPLWRLLCSKASISMSNVPGPQFDLAWCGSPLRLLLFFVPPTGRLSVFVTIATFNGEVTVGLGVDAKLIETQDLSRICGELFEAEIRRLGASARP